MTPPPAERLRQAAELDRRGQTAAALAILLDLLAEQPELAAAQFGAADMLYRLGRRDEAIERLQNALAQAPAPRPARLQLARWLAARAAQGDHEQALHLLAAGCQEAPAEVEWWAEYFFTLFDARRYAEALSAVDRALALAPQSASLHTNRAAVLFKLNRLDESAAEDEAALRLNPGLAAARQGLLLTCERLGEIERAQALASALVEAAPARPDYFSQLLCLGNYRASENPAASLANHREWARRFADPLPRYPAAPASHFAPGRRLRLGYVSPDFVQHSVSYFIEPLLAHHDRQAFEVFAYHCAPHSDAVTARLRGQVEHWREVARLDARQLAEQIRADGIDLLVDLAGHTAGNRLQTFALKPAAVQFTYLGYPNTSGLSAIDYRITDQRADPAGEGGACASETLLRLPDCFHCYRPAPGLPEPGLPPSVASGGVTFGSFNVLAKISDETIAAWAAILAALPGATLRLKSFGLLSQRARDRLQQRLVAAGLAPGRLVLDAATASHEEHMGRYRTIDIGLDTFPYNGTTTTCEALWMGVPVVTLAGDRHAARVGASLLGAAGLPELVAGTVTDYVQRAVALAGDGARLRHYHATLRATLAASPLTDGARFTRALEALYREAWAEAGRRATAGVS